MFAPLAFSPLRHLREIPAEADEPAPPGGGAIPVVAYEPEP